jgi:Arc/MetJ family transcription regulator
MMCMRTNIVLDDELVAEAAQLTGIKTKKALVHEALRTLIRVRKRKNLLELQGKIAFEPAYDHKVLRSRGA